MKIKETLRKLHIYKFYKAVSLWYRFPKIASFKRDFTNLNSNSVILLGTPLHRNLGDHLIADAEKSFLHEIMPQKSIFEIPTEVFLCFERFITTNANKEIDVFITGGGWMGSLWPEDELILQQMIYIFKDSKIVILPQTVFYEENDIQAEELLRSANRVLSLCKNIKLCTRDVHSYEFSLEKTPIQKERVLLAPDIGLFYVDSTTDVTEKKAVGVYLRNDREKETNNEIVNTIKDNLVKKGFSFFYSDTMYSNNIPVWKRKAEIDKTLINMKSCQIILTDRLHGMIYSTIARRKCIVLNNKTNKVFGVYNKWLKWNKNVLYVDNEVYSKINEKLDQLICSTCEEKTNREVLDSDFNKLRDFILHE